VGKIFDSIDPKLRDWLEAQPVYFVGTAPMSAEGHINISPKGGLGTFRVLGPRSVGYLDRVGSGIETISHLRENGRIVLMFCAFTGPPKIVRLQGRGRAVPQSNEEFRELIERFAPVPDEAELARSIVAVELDRIADSCGFGVPTMELVGERRQLFDWAKTKERKEGDGWKSRYLRANNRISIDGLPGLDIEGDLALDEEEALSAVGKAL
jgi:Pyridoxamine 5'-phosphate oxidase